MGKYFNDIIDSVQTILDEGLQYNHRCSKYEHNLEYELKMHLSNQYGFTRVTSSPPQSHNCCNLVKSRNHKWNLRSQQCGCNYQRQNINLEIDIICKGKSNRDIVCIELKNIYYYPTTDPFSSHDYKYLYGLSQSLKYWTLSKKHNFCCGFIWNGGPSLFNVICGKYFLSFFQEGQIWWDIARLIEIKKHYPNSERYLVGFVKLAKGTQVRGMCHRLDEIVKKMQSWPNSKEVYNVYNGILQKCKYNNFSYDPICLYPNSNNPLNMAMGYVIEIT